MKKIALSFFTLVTTGFLLSCTLSCKENNSEPEIPEDPGEIVDPVPEGPQPGEYTFTVSPLKGRWESGDRIYVHGSYGPAAKTVTLAASDISEDGLRACVQLDDVFEFCLSPDNLYAAWPAEAVLQNDGILSQSTEFAVFDKPVAVAYLNGNDFTFVDASSCLKFKVSGYKDFAVAGTQRPGLRFTSYTATFSSDGANWLGHRDDGYPFRYGEFKGDEAVLWFPGTVKLDGGLAIYLGDGETWTAMLVNEELTRIKAGEVADLGDITASLATYSGPVPKMPEMVGRTKFTINLPELSGLCMSDDKTFMWTVGDEGDLARISLDGELIAGSVVHIGGDCEGVALDPVTKNLIIGTEPNSVYQVACPDYNTRTKLFSIDDAKGYGNAGQEGITCYKDGMIYSGMQTGSELYRIDLETGDVLMKKNLRQIFPVITEIADLEYDPETDWLWIVDSEAKKLFALTGDAESLLGAYSIKTPSNPESLCIDHANACIWVGDDYGTSSYLYRYDFTGLDDPIINK